MEEKCQYYLEGKAKKAYFLGKENIICPLKPKECPYENGFQTFFELEPITLCETKALIGKIENN